MSVCGVTHLASIDGTFPEETPPELSYEYVDRGFYYTVARLDRGREFISLPGLTATQVQELFENGKVFPPENLDGNLSFGFTHGWQVDRYKVGIVAEDGVLSYSVYDEAGTIIHDEEIPQNDGDDNPLPSGEIYCRYLRSTPFIHPDGKVNFVHPDGKGNFFVRPIYGVDALPKWGWGDKILSLLKDDGQFVWQIFDRVTETTRRIAFADITLENPGNNFYADHLYNGFRPLVRTESLFPNGDVNIYHLMRNPSNCVRPESLLPSGKVNFNQFLSCVSYPEIEQLKQKISKLIQTFFLKVCVTSDNQIEPLLFSPSEAFINTKSRLDPNITINESRWAVTLVNSKAPSLKWPHGHAVLLIEKFEDGQYKMMRAHFTVNGGYCKALVGTSPGKVKYEEVDPSYRYHSNTETWSLPRCNIEKMIKEIIEEISIQDKGEVSVFFSGCGPNIWTPSLIKTQAGKLISVDNCLSWAIDKLFMHGAKLYHHPEGKLMNRPVVYISSYQEIRRKAILEERLKEFDRRLENIFHFRSEEEQTRAKLRKLDAAFRQIRSRGKPPSRLSMLSRFGNL